MGSVRTSPRYVTDISGPDLLSLVDLEGGGVFRKKLEK